MSDKSCEHKFHYCIETHKYVCAGCEMPLNQFVNSQEKLRQQFHKNDYQEFRGKYA